MAYGFYAMLFCYGIFEDACKANFIGILEFGWR